MFAAAFYKGTQPGLHGVYNRGVRWWCHGPYSHVELVFGDGIAASSSFMDGGVRFKQIAFDPAKWDMVPLDPAKEAAARAWFEQHAGQRYSVLGNVHFVLGPVGDEKNAWFCSEAAAAALGIPDAYRFEPNELAATLRWPLEPSTPPFQRPISQ